MKIVCDYCLEWQAVWYRVRDLFLCPLCMEAYNAKNTAKKNQEKREAEQREVESART